MERLVVPQGDFALVRHPVRSKETLRAWDAADEYLLRSVADPSTGADRAETVVVVNDGSGALSVALADRRPWLLSDSYLAHLATHDNLVGNGIDPAAVTLLGSFDPPPERIDLLLIKVPKSLALLDDQLRRLRPHLHAGTVVIGSAMVKHLHSSSLECFERRIGPTTTSRAEKKARLVLSTLDPALDGVEPGDGSSSYVVEPGGRVVTSHAGVFAADQLDIGTRFLLENLPDRSRDRAGSDQVVDLGCGNGVVGMMTAVADPDADLTFIDESYRSVASAEMTFRANLGPDRPARFVVGNGLVELSDGEPLARGGVDRVVNNPPFHIDRAIGDEVAWQMFRESKDVLRPGGELWVIGNRHLAYHAKLKRIFGNAEVVASNAKFVVLRSVNRAR